MVTPVTIFVNLRQYFTRHTLMINTELPIRTFVMIDAVSSIDKFNGCIIISILISNGIIIGRDWFDYKLLISAGLLTLMHYLITYAVLWFRAAFG